MLQLISLVNAVRVPAIFKLDHYRTAELEWATVRDRDRVGSRRIMILIDIEPAASRARRRRAGGDELPLPIWALKSGLEPARSQYRNATGKCLAAIRKMREWPLSISAPP
jgi:hypothetical protein